MYLGTCQVQLQEDLDNKDLALDIDNTCFQLRNNSKNIALQVGKVFYSTMHRSTYICPFFIWMIILFLCPSQAGVENIDASGSEPESWRRFSSKNREESQARNNRHVTISNVQGIIMK